MRPEVRSGYWIHRNRPAKKVTQVAGSVLCKLGLHHFVDFPDPNPETRGIETQGYKACTRCPKEKDVRVYLKRTGGGGQYY